MTQNISDPKFISISNLAKRWGMSNKTIWRKCKSGQLMARKLGDNSIWYIEMEKVLSIESDSSKEPSTN